jgi:antitoxin (DNA-binding transcriptional repressor) of toxin-antitoxin stability system
MAQGSRGAVRQRLVFAAGLAAEGHGGWERVTLTVNRRPIADILPHVQPRDPWVPAAELRRIVDEASADPGLLEDLADVRGDEIDDD